MTTYEMRVEGAGVNWTKTLADEQEFNLVNKYRAQSIPSYNLCIGYCKPIRTNNWKNLAKDLFLPSFVNGALKVDSLALTIFLALFCIPLDLIFLPIRLITLIPRLITNCRAPEHPLTTYLKRVKVPQEILEEGRILVTLTKEERQQLPAPPAWVNPASWSSTKVNQTRTRVNLIEMPTDEDYHANHVRVIENH